MKNCRINTIDPREEVFAMDLLHNKSDSICYIESDEAEVYIIDQFGFMYMLKMNLNQVKALLPPHKFINCGYNIVINIDMIQEVWIFETPLVVMLCGNTLSIPQNMIHRIEKHLNRKLTREKVEVQD